MIIYNVTCNIAEDMEEEWVHWMKTVHIPEVISTGLFSGYKMMKLLTVVSDNEGVNYAIQYHCDTLAHYEEYASLHAPGLQAKTRERYGDKILAFRTILQEV